jgi:uridine phosphorylase
VILGRWHPQEPLTRWREYLSDAHAPDNVWHNALFGVHGGKRVAFAVVYGPTMAADVARAFQLLGVRALVQIGYYGGLQRGMKRGDFILPTEAIREDGASHAYLPQDQRVHADAGLHAHLAAQINTRCDALAAEFPDSARSVIHALPHLTIAGGILSETREQIAAWGALGYGGVDLETATTFSVAHRFGVPCAAVMVCSDVVAEGDSLFVREVGDARARYLRAQRVMEEAVLSLTRVV